MLQGTGLVMSVSLCIDLLHYSDVTWASRRFKLIFFQLLVQANNIENRMYSPRKGSMKRKSFQWHDIIMLSTTILFMWWISVLARQINDHMMQGDMRDHNNTHHNTLKLELPDISKTTIPSAFHDDVINWKHFQRYWPVVRGIHRWPVNYPHKGQWRGVLMFSLICASINGWVNNREAGDLRRYRTHNDVIVMFLKENVRISHISQKFLPEGPIHKLQMSFTSVFGLPIYFQTNHMNLILKTDYHWYCYWTRT